jgi:G-patch domain
MHYGKNFAGDEERDPSSRSNASNPNNRHFVKNHEQKQHKDKGKKPRGGPNDAAKPRMGDVVGDRAKPLTDSNLGHRMLMKMGWTPGVALGAEANGILDPITATIRSKRGGLGGE